MLNQQSLLTVVIPTIGRKSIENALKSIDLYSNLIIVIDNKYSKFFDSIRCLINELDTLGYKFREVTVIVSKNEGPGRVKDEGIDLVKTKYFVILDDDDEFVPGYLKFALDKLEENKADWISTHYDKTPSRSMTDEVKTIIPIDFINHYFDTDHYENKLNYIYPGSETICNTERFKQLIQSNIFLRYHTDYLDDVIPMTTFMSSTLGLLHLGEGVKYGQNVNTVSHQQSDPTEFPGFQAVVNDICKILTNLKTPNVDRRVWKQALTNLLDVTYFNYKFSQNPQRS